MYKIATYFPFAFDPPFSYCCLDFILLLDLWASCLSLLSGWNYRYLPHCPACFCINWNLYFHIIKSNWHTSTDKGKIKIYINMFLIFESVFVNKNSFFSFSKMYKHYFELRPHCFGYEGMELIISRCLSAWSSTVPGAMGTGWGVELKNIIYYLQPFCCKI